MALNNLERFVAAARNPLSMGTLFERDPTALPTLVRFLDLSALQRPAGPRPGGLRPVAAQRGAARGAANARRRPRRRGRGAGSRPGGAAGCGGSSGARPCGSPTATSSASKACTPSRADFLFGRRDPRRGVAGGVAAARPQRGTPRGPDGRQARFVVLGMGKLGGRELNYSSDIDLIFLYDGDGKTDGKRPITNGEFFDALARELIRLLTETTELGAAYRVDMRLRPEGQRGPMVASRGGVELLRHVAGGRGSGRRTSRPCRSPATWTSAMSSSNNCGRGFIAATSAARTSAASRR